MIYSIDYHDQNGDSDSVMFEVINEKDLAMQWYEYCVDCGIIDITQEEDADSRQQRIDDWKAECQRDKEMLE